MPSPGSNSAVYARRQGVAKLRIARLKSGSRSETMLMAAPVGAKSKGPM